MCIIGFDENGLAEAGTLNDQGDCIANCGENEERNSQDDCVCKDGFVRNEFGDCIEKEECETGDEILDNPEIQKALEQIWKYSGVKSLDVPLTDRLETGGWIVENSDGTLDFIFFPPVFTRTVCGIYPPQNFMDYVPENIKAIVHTHPFYFGENTKEVCGEEGDESYDGEPSNPDYVALAKIVDSFTNAEIRGYVVDGNSITKYDIFHIYGLESFTRCGY